MSLTVAELAERLGAELAGNVEQAGRQVVGVAAVEAARDDQISFAKDAKHRKALADCSAAAVIVSERCEEFPGPQLVVENVDAALIEALRLFAPKLRGPKPGIDPTAKVSPDAKIESDVSIGAFVEIAEGVQIGKGTVIGSGCKIGENTKIGQYCRLDSNVVVYHNCRLGDYVVVQANTTIGSTGFGYSFVDGAHRLIPHNGGVVIEDYVEIGANCCVDRAKFGDTIIGAGTKIDNLVQVAHNVVIGKCCLIAALVGISGSCKLGDGVVLGGQVGLADNIEVGAGTMVGAQAGVMADVPAGSRLAWTPALDRREVLRVVSLIRRLPRFAEQIKQLSKRVDGLEASKDHKK